MTKIAVTVMAIALLTMLFVVPAMATPKEESPAWHAYPATDTYVEVTYDQLTQWCKDAGLKSNPYPVPTPTTDDHGFPIEHLAGSEYFVFTMTIGDKVYSGVACNTYVGTLNWNNGQLHFDYQSIHYFGDLGKMNHGFEGVVTLDIQYTLTGSVAFFYANWQLQGFGQFTGQSLTLNQDSRKGEVIATGECLVLGKKWYK